MQEEAVARVVDAVETGQRWAAVRGDAGLGRSTVLARAARELRRPDCRIARVGAPVDGTTLWLTLAEGLGTRPRRGASRAAAWAALREAVRLCRWQKLSAVLLVDDAQTLCDDSDRSDLDRLVDLEPGEATRLTVVAAFREPEEPADEPTHRVPWELDVRLTPLRLSDTTSYVETKLAAAGRTESLFTPRAFVRLHDLSGGVPRGIDRLASLSLMAAALRRLEVVTPDVVEGVLRECLSPSRPSAA
jgi:type II secretory pathway predicted ATPase ExeA